MTLLVQVVATECYRRSYWASGRRIPILVLVGLIVYLSVVHGCQPPRPTGNRPSHYHCRHTTRVLCAVNQSQTRVASGHRMFQMLHWAGDATALRRWAVLLCFVLVLQTADIYPRLLCADCCNNSTEYIARVCGDDEVLRVNGFSVPCE